MGYIEEISAQRPSVLQSRAHGASNASPANLFDSMLQQAQANLADESFETVAYLVSGSELPQLVRENSKPTSYDDIIQQAANEYNLEVNLIKAVIQVESSFKRYAVSDAGARGLMQLMPDTAAGLGVRDSFDPRQNIMGGAAYLRRQLDEFGDIRLALAAYNTGPNRIKDLDISDADDTKEYRRITQRVRNYVEGVLRYYGEYNAGETHPSV